MECGIYTRVTIFVLLLIFVSDAGTKILEIPTPAGVTWSMRISYDQYPSLVGQLDPYLILQRVDGADFIVTVNKQMDIEDIYNKLGTNIIQLRLTCTQTGHQAQTQDVFVQIDPVNEYSPEFVDSPYTVNISEKEAMGFMIITLSSKARDLDVRPSTGEIFAYSIEPFDYDALHGKPGDDGRDYFTMANPQTGRIEVGKKLDFETLAHNNRTSMWLNVTVTVSTYETLAHNNRTSMWLNVTVTVSTYETLALNNRTSMWLNVTVTVSTYETLAHNNRTSMWFNVTVTVSTYETLAHNNRTSMWLNVTVTDYSFNTNWTTVRINVKDADDLSPEFYVASDCVPQPLKYPPCYITYKAKVLVNTTGKVDQIEPSPIYAHDRDTIDNPVTYTLVDSANIPGVASHFELNKTSGVLKVVTPFTDTGVYSFYVEAQEMADNMFKARATLQVDVYSPTHDPWATTESAPMSTRKGNGGGANGGGGANVGGGVNSGGGGGAKGNNGHSDSDKDGDSDGDSKAVAVIGMSVLGVVVVVLVIALFITCLMLRKHRPSRVGSANPSTRSTKSFVNDEELPSTSREPSPDLRSKKQEDLLSSLPQPNQRGNKLPPLQPATGGAIHNPDLFDGTRSFDNNVGREFFIAPGKTKVPLLPSAGQAQPLDPIYIDDDIVSS
ncbi:protocadherin alpha-11-like [Littorina saxatilis]|uniref:protocadherin alpha-11-like n=1 Tax=Littorina saxatilis TaxID=31220 RepID=UPI0038B5C058